MTITTTLNDIRSHDPSPASWEKLLKHLGKAKADDEPLPLLTILESNGLDDALWCLRALDDRYQGPIRLLACDFAEQALKYGHEGEDRPRQAIETARKYARGEATAEELAAARAAAWEAARAAAAAAWVIGAADAARAADAAAAADAARAAADAARAARAADAARAAVRAAADAAWEEQARIFREWLECMDKEPSK